MRYAFDTNVWRYVLSHRSFAESIGRMQLSPVGLPAVVMFELLRGTRTAEARRRVEAICRRLSHATLAPLNADWHEAALVCHAARRRWRYDDEGLRRLQNDALIACLCARSGWTLVTTNKRDFERLVAVRRGLRAVFLAAPS